ncbi:unnamed protein product, partial [Allacma fusca]
IFHTPHNSDPVGITGANSGFLGPCTAPFHFMLHHSHTDEIKRHVTSAPLKVNFFFEKTNNIVNNFPLCWESHKFTIIPVRFNVYSTRNRSHHMSFIQAQICSPWNAYTYRFLSFIM